MDTKQFRVLIKHCFFMGKNTVETRQWLEKCYGHTSPSRQMVEKWFAEFKRGRTNTDDAERSGRPKSVVVPENIKRVHKIILQDPNVKLRDIADTLKISEGSVFTILHENLIKSEADLEEEGILQDLPSSSITCSSVDTSRSKKASSVSSVPKVLTPRKRKTKAVTEGNPPEAVLRRGRSALLEIQEAVPLTPTRRTRKSSQDSVASDASVESKTSSRRKSKSEVSDSDEETAATKKGNKLKNTSIIKEEPEEEIAKPKRRKI